MSSKQSRTIIRKHHVLQKELQKAVAKGDAEAASSIQRSIEENGGLKVYQAASKQGQAKSRGGDSSKVLVDWLKELKVIASIQDAPKSPFRLLEVGALSTDNEISKFPSKIEVTRIDLNSQGPGIEQQDFMDRPLPVSTQEQFDIISLSLVLNYVPDPLGRGEMLKRVTQFLRKHSFAPEDKAPVLPALFLVLPLPCVANSRYLDEATLLQIMVNLGFSLTKKKDTSKLCYYFFTLTGEANHVKSQKRLIRDKPGMNNFCIVID